MSKAILVIPQGSYQTVAQPRYVSLLTTDSYATITAAGYLNKLQNGNDILVGDLISALYGANINGLFTVAKSAGVLTMAPLSGAGEVSYIGSAPVAGNIPKFSGVTGDITDSLAAPSNPALTVFSMFSGTSANNALAVFADAAGSLKPASATVTSGFGITAATGSFIATLGSLVSGNSSGGAVGTMQLFPTTTTTGSLRWLAAANAGAFNVDFTNASHAQSTVYTIADLGAATGGVPVATAPFRMKQVAGAAAAGGAAAQSFTDAFCTSASNIIGNWNTQANAASVLKIVPGNGSFVVTSSADAGVGTFNYVIMKA